MDTKEVARRLRDACNGNQAAWARSHKLSATYVSDVVNGHRKPSAAILKALGLRKVVGYEPVGKSGL